MADLSKLPPPPAGYTVTADPSTLPPPPAGYTVTNVLDDPRNKLVGESNGIPVYQNPGGILNEAVINPAKQVAAGFVGASATANRMTANLADMADSLATHISNVTGLEKGGLFHSIGEWARNNQHAQEQDALKLSGGRQDFASQLYRGGTQGLAELPTYATAGAIAGPAAGLAIVGAIRESDKGWTEALKAAAEGALMGKALEVMGPASRAIRLTGAAAMTYAQARLNGADHTTALANATTMGALAGHQAGGAGVGDIARMNLPERPIFKSTLNPIEQDAVDYLRSEDVPLRAGVQTGNRYLQAAEGVTAATPLGSVRAAELRAKTEAGLHRVGRKLMQGAYPEPVTPESAATDTRAELDSRIGEFQTEADAGYGDAWKGRDQQQLTERVPVGKTSDGKTVMGVVNMPVDVREIKDLAQPIRQELDMSLSRAEQGQSKAFNALEKLLAGDDHVPAWMAERALSALKSLARTDNKTGVRDYGQGVAAGLIPKLQEAVDAAVAKTGDEAIRGLQQGRAAHANMMDVVDVAEKLRSEPVQAFGQMVWAHDSGLSFLRRIAFDAPESMPKIGRAYVQQLFDLATREGGISRTRQTLNKWRDLGPETKKMLFPDPAVRSGLERFFKGLDMVVDRTNPSGTEITRQATSMNPLKWIAGGVGGRLLFTPRGISLLTEAMRTPPASPRGRAIRDDLQQLIERLPAEPVSLGPKPAAPVGKLSSGGTQSVQFPSRSARMGGSFDLGVIDDGKGNAGEVGEGLSDDEAPGARAEIGPAEASTEIRIPGAPNRYKAFYQVRELADLQPSHSGHTFQPNERYQLKNDRDYSQPENQGKVVNWSGPEFDPSYHITDNPDASNGPPVIDEVGNVYGGNGRTMILQRVYQGNATGAQAYRQRLEKKAQQFGIDPAEFKGMKQPVLVRVIPDEDMAAGGSKQRAVTDFNKTGTAALRGSEKAIADSRRVSLETLDSIASRLESAGSDATLASILEGKGGAEVLNKLIQDGVISPQESAAYVDRGVLTGDGKIRISKLMLGRFFRDPAQLDITPASVRNKLERIAAPLAKAEGRPAWSLAKPLQEAIDLLEEARAHGQKNLDDVVGQSGLFGSQKYSDQAVQLAKAIRDANPNDLTKAVRQYAQDAAEADQGAGLFGEPPTPAESFAAAFDALGKRTK